jgi:uncharacterized protein (DUF488 family)
VSTQRERQLRNKRLWNADRPREKADFYTIGYSGRTLEQVVGALADAGVRSLVDVRAYPVSIYRPEFSKTALAQVLALHGIEYISMRKLGVPKNRRAQGTASRELVDVWSWYDAEVGTPFVQEGVALCRGKRRPLAFMCTELDPTTCHRHRLALTLAEAGLSSYDL